MHSNVAVEGILCSCTIFIIIYINDSCCSSLFALFVLFSGHIVFSWVVIISRMAARKSDLVSRSLQIFLISKICCEREGEEPS